MHAEMHTVQETLTSREAGVSNSKNSWLALRWILPAEVRAVTSLSHHPLRLFMLSE